MTGDRAHCSRDQRASCVSGRSAQGYVLSAFAISGQHGSSLSPSIDRIRRRHRQAVRGDRAHGADPGRTAPARRARAVRARRACHRLRRAPGERGRPPGRADGQRVRVPARALAQRRARVGLRDYETVLRQVSGKQEGRDARNALRTLVRGLRQKLGDTATDSKYILTERGVGYRMPRPGGM